MTTLEEIKSRYSTLCSSNPELIDKIVTDLRKIEDNAERIEYAHAQGMDWRYSKMVPSGQFAMDLIRYGAL